MLSFDTKEEARTFIESTFPISDQEQTEEQCSECGEEPVPGTRFSIEGDDDYWFVCDNSHATAPDNDE